MQKIMPHLWLIRFKLSAAIALPSMSLLWLVLPASAVESVHQHTADLHPLSEPSSEVSWPRAANEEGANLNPALSQRIAEPRQGHASSTHQFSEPPALVPPSVSTTLHRTAQPPQKHLEKSDTGLPEVTAIPRQVESANVSALFSQHFSQENTLTSPQSGTLGTLLSQDPLPESPEIPKDETFSPLPEAESIDDTETDDTEQLRPSEQEDSTMEGLEESGDGDDSEVSTEAPSSDDQIPRLPEATESEDVIEEGDAAIEDSSPNEQGQPLLEELEESEDDIEDRDDTIPVPSIQAEPTPVFPTESFPNSAETTSDQLQHLDPFPNPLIIQTEPGEVEIIETLEITLEQALGLAYRNNPDIQIAQLELEEDLAALRAAQADLLPDLAVSGTIQGQDTPDTATEDVLGAFGTAQIGVTYDIFTSGFRSGAIGAAREQVRFSELNLEITREELRIDTTNEYYDLQEAIESIRISEAFLEEAELNLTDTALREEVGVGTRFDTLRAEVQVAEAQQDVVNAEANRKVAERILASRLNLPPSISITTVPVEVAGQWVLTLEESITLAFQNRAELEQQLALRDLNEQQRRQALSAIGPQIDLFANYTISDLLTRSEFTTSFESSPTFGVQVMWTLFDGGAARASARQEELQIAIAERTFEDFRNAIRAEVESAFFTLESNLENIETAEKAVEQAKEALDLAELRFDAGVGTQLDVLTATSELTDAEVNLLSAQVGYNRSLAELERAVSNVVLERSN